MTNLYHRISTFLSGCWAFITSILFSFGSTACSLSRGLWRAISALALKFLPEKADWRIVERMCSESVREKINVFGRHPRNTGALCSSLL